MTSHLWFLLSLSTLRAAGGFFLAVLFIYFSNPANVPRGFPINLSRYHALAPGDTEAFVIVGIVIAALACVRLLFALGLLRLLLASRAGSARLRSGTRFLGIALAVLDIIDLTFFPLTTACGLYAWLVLRHPDTVDVFEQQGLLERAGLHPELR